MLAPTIQSYFESEEGQREFEQWKKSRQSIDQRSDKSETDSGDAA